MYIKRPLLKAISLDLPEPDLHTVPNYNTPSSGPLTSITSLVPQMTILPTRSIKSTTMVVRPSSAMRATAATRTIVSTAVVTSSSRKSGDKDSSSSKTNRLSTLVIVVIAVSGGVTVVLAVSCYIWRRRNSGRFLSFFSVFEYLLYILGKWYD